MAEKHIPAKIKSYFSASANRQNLESGEEIQTSLSKVKKWFSDLEPIAFSGSYNDLSNTPTIPSTVSITGAVEGSGSFTNGTASIAANRRACNIGNTTSTAAPDKPWYLVADYVVPASNNNFNRITFLVQAGYGNTVARMNNVGILDVLTRINVNGTLNTLRANWILSGYSINTNDFVAIYNSTTRKISLYAKITESYSTYRFVVLAESSNYNNVDVAELWTLYNTRTGGENNIATLPPDSESVTNATSTLATLEAGTVYMNSPEIDRTAATLETDVSGTGRFILRDKNNKQIGIINPSRLTDGRERLYIAVNSEKNNSTITNYLILDIAQDGTCSYRVSDPAAFRAAIDAAYIEQVDQILEYGGYNRLPLDNVTADNGITYTVDKKNGTITVTEVVTTGTPQIRIDFPAELSGNYYFSALTSTGSDSTYDAYVYCTTDSARPKQWDGTTGSPSDYGSGDCEIQLDATKSYGMRIRFRRSMTGNFVFKPMIYSEYLKGIPFQPYAMTNVELTQNKASVSGDNIPDKEAFRTAIDCPQNKQLTNEDLNSITVPGFYCASSNNSCANKPVSGSFGLVAIHSATSNYWKQYFFPITATAKPYFRSGNNGTWSDWRQISDISTTFYGTCSTAADSKNKEVTLSNSIGWQLTEGVVVGVKFTNSNTYANATDSPITLNVEGTGAKNIWYGSTHSGAGNTGTSTSIYGYAGRITYYMYDGTYWVWMGMSYLDGNTIPSAYCTTAASTAAKTASCTGYSLLANSYIHVLISNSNSAKSALTLSINSKTAKAIYINGTASSSSNYTLPAGTYLVFYDGTNYYFRTDGKITSNSIVDTSNNDIMSNYLPLSGGTITGDITLDNIIARESLKINNISGSNIYPAFKVKDNGYDTVKLDIYPYLLESGNQEGDIILETKVISISNSVRNHNTIGSAATLRPGLCDKSYLGNSTHRWDSFYVWDIDASGDIKLSLETGSGTTVQIDSDGYLIKQSSTRDVKHNINYITDYNNYHNALMNLKPATFIYNSDTTNTTKLGMIAEDVNDICSVATIKDKSGKVENYDDRAVIAMLVMEVQRINKEIEKLRGEINGQAK